MARKKHPPHLVSRSEFSRLAEVSPASITKACKGKGKLVAARVADRIDVTHPNAVAYLEKKGKKPPRIEPDDDAPLASVNPNELDQLDPKRFAELDRIEPFASMTIRELVDRFGGRRAFRDWLDALKKIEDIRKTRLDNDTTEGELISRELVESHVFGALEALSRKLLQDMPKTAARRLEAAVKAGEKTEECERILRDLLSKQLRPTKAEAARKLRNA